MFKKYLVLIFGLGLIHSLAFARVEDPYWLEAFGTRKLKMVNFGGEE